MRVRSLLASLAVALLAAAGCSSAAATSPTTSHPGADADLQSTDSGTADSAPSSTESGASDDSLVTPVDDTGTAPPSDDSGTSTPKGDASSSDPDTTPEPADSSPPSPADSGSTATCGCNGMAGCAVWENVYVTFYGFNDNSCTVESEHSCDDIAYPGLGPKKHPVATEGVGTYDDPITAAASDQGYETAGGATLSPGTIIYNPLVQKYFIMEDSCLECGDEWKCHLSSDDTDDPNPPSGCKASTYLHIDFWMGPDFASDSSTLNDCEDNSTLGNPYQGVGTVVVNPPPNLPVKLPLMFTDSGAAGGCWTKSQATPVSCP